MLRRLLVLATALLSAFTLTLEPATAAAWRTTGTSWENPDARAPKITNIRYATHPNFDRVVIDIYGQQLPGYRTGYTRTHHYDGSGAVVPIRGGLWISMNPAYAHRLDGSSTYVGPDIVRPGFKTLKAIAFTGDFEGYVSFAFGLSYHAPYRILRLHAPQRIVIDFKHAS
jgi:hypothetical protein